MEFRPILSAMLRNKTGAILVALQIAITLAVVANSVFIINKRLEKIGRPSGMDTSNLIFIQSYGYAPGYNHAVTLKEDLDLIRSLPGVRAASPINGIPLSGGGSSSTFKAEPKEGVPDQPGNYYEIDEQGLDALGVKLAAGRSFTPDIIKVYDAPSSDFVPEIIVTKTFAKAMFGTDDANAVLGRKVYDSLNQGATVIGVVEHQLGAWVGWDKLEYVVYYPVVGSGPILRYVVRTQPGAREALIPELEKKLSDLNHTRVISWVRPHEYYIERSYKSDVRMAVFLAVLIGLLVAMTALGIVGLASFTVNARVKQIGTRRAMGARRVDILRYFMLENWLLTSIGVVVGCVLAFGLSYWLSTAYELPKLNPLYVVAGIIGMWIIGQLAVFVPARRAASVPPAVATRTV